MLKRHISVLLLASLMFLAAFSKQDPILVQSVEINVMKTAGILRYDIVLKKTRELELDNNAEAGDSPGHELFHQRGNEINFAVRPNNTLASLMELVPKTKFVKMQIRGAGSSGNLRTEEEVTFYLEYAMKKGVDFEKVRKSALDSTLLVLVGNKVVAEIPLEGVTVK